MRIINFNDGFTSAAAPTIDVAASGVSVVASNGLVATNAQAAFDELQVDSNAYAAHVANTSNPHSVTKTQVGLSAVTNDAQVKRTEMGAVSGVATLDSSGTVPLAQIPAAILGANIYQGTWNALTNSPALASSVGTKGYFYYVSSAGTTNLNGITDWAINDIAIFNGSAWQKIDNTDAVASVAGRTGVVVLTSTDVGLGNVDNTSDATKNAAAATLASKTLASPDITTQASYKAGAEERFYNAGNTHYVGFKGPNSVADKIWTLPLVDGSGGQVLKTDGFATLGWVSALTDPLTARGDIMYRNTSNVTAPLVIGSTGKFLRSDGTDPSWQTLVTGDIPTTLTGKTLTTADLSSSTNTLRAATLSAIGAVVNGATTYTNTGLTWTNTSTPGTYSVVARRTGNLVNVMLTFPTTTVSSGSAISIGALAADFQPSTTKYTCLAGLLNATNNMSLIGITTAGNILIYKNTNFGVWTIGDTTNTAGVALSFTYSLD